MAYLRFLFILLTALISSISYAAQLTIAFGYNRAPFIIHNSDHGIEIDIVTQALKLVGHSVVIKHLSNEDLHLQLPASSELDASSSVRDKYSMLAQMYYSDNYVAYENIAISLKSRHLNINSITELAGLKVIAWKLARDDLGAVFKKTTNELGNKYFEFTDQNDQNRSFWAGLADIIVVDKSIFDWYRKKLKAEYDTSKAVVIHAIFPPETFFKMAFKNKQYRDDFNKGLGLLRASGKYKKIYQKYMAK